MRGGPLFPYSVVPLDPSYIYPWVYVGSGPGTNRYEECLGVTAVGAADRTLALRFRLPPIIPEGSPFLELLTLSIATTGVAKVNPYWTCAQSGTDPSSFTLTAEGTQTVTFTGSSAHRYLPTRVPLDAEMLYAGSTLVMNLVFETSGWTVAPITGWLPTVIWE